MGKGWYKGKGTPGFGNPNRKKLKMEQESSDDGFSPGKKRSAPIGLSKKSSSRSSVAADAAAIGVLGGLKGGLKKFRENEMINRGLARDSGFYGHSNVPSGKKDSFYRNVKNNIK